MNPPGRPTPDTVGEERPADVAVVLGAAVGAGGVPSASLARRVHHAARLLLEDATTHLLLTGGVGRHPPSEAEVMRRLAERDGVDPSRIIVEDRSRTTLESAARCAPLITARGWHDVLLVTDRYHLPRALLAFRAYGIHAQGSAPSNGHAGTSSWRWTYMYLREAAAFPWYLLRTRCSRHRWRPAERDSPVSR